MNELVCARQFTLAANKRLRQILDPTDKDFTISFLYFKFTQTTIELLTCQRNFLKASPTYIPIYVWQIVRNIKLLICIKELVTYFPSYNILVYVHLHSASTVSRNSFISGQ